MIREAIQKVIAGDALTEAEMIDTMNEIMEGKTTDAQIACFLTALRIKGETIEEITGGTRAMRAKATPVPTRHKSDLQATPKVPRLVDTCSTGGTGYKPFQHLNNFCHCYRWRRCAGRKAWQSRRDATER